MAAALGLSPSGSNPVWVRVPPPILNTMKKALPILPLTDKDHHRFWKKVQRRRWNQCWIWMGKKSRYGLFYLSGGGYVGAHRASYTIATGLDPGEMQVCHTCDNPLCVNPRHLWLGTDLDNIADMDKKGRRVNKGAPGEKNVHAKLTQKQVNRIRYLRATKNYTYYKLAGMFDVSLVTIHHIVTGKTWRS